MSMLPVETNIVYLVGKPSLFGKHIFHPYEDLVCGFLSELSSVLMQDAVVASLPDVVAFAFFCRKSNITKLMKEYAEPRLRMGVGTVFHIAPSNVPVNFAFSFVFGLLSGNSNIVRVPSKTFRQVDVIVVAINQVLTSEKYDKLRMSTIFVRYKQANAVTAAFSAICNARVIWGGDASIRDIKAIAVPIRAVEIAFADRYSFCAMDAGVVCRADEKDLRRLASGFYNDTYLMDQNACSSPHLVIWLGDDADVKAASGRFWQCLYEEALKRYTFHAVTALDKLTSLCEWAIDLPKTSQVKRYENLLYVITLSSLPTNPEKFRGKCGFFFEFQADSLDVIAPRGN